MTNDRLRYRRVLSKGDKQHNYAKECVVNSFPEEVTNNFLSHKYMFIFANDKKGVIEIFEKYELCYYNAKRIYRMVDVILLIL